MKQKYLPKLIFSFLILFFIGLSSNANNTVPSTAEKKLKEDPTKPFLPFFVDDVAEVQLIHNSPDPTLNEVDIYVNDELIQSNFSFRTATSFLTLPADEDLDIAVAIAGSSSSASAFFTTTLNLIADEKYVVVANGVQDANLFNSSVNTSIGFSLDVFQGARETAIAIAGNTDILVHHGVTDYPNLDISEISIPIPNFITNLAFSNFNNYVQIATNNYTIQPEFSDGSAAQATYDLPLPEFNLQNKAVTLLTSGFLDPQANQNGPEFGLWLAVPEGGQLLELPFEGNCITFTSPFTEDFSSSDWVAGTGFQNTGDAIDECWARDPGNISGVYSWGTRSGGTSVFGSGPSGAFSNQNYVYTKGLGSVGDQAFFTSPIISTANLSNPSISFYYHMFGNAMGSLEVEVQEFGAANWTTLTTISGQQQSASGDDWLQQEIELSSFENKNIQFRFVATRGSGFNSEIAIDLMQVQEATTCLLPSNISISELSDNSVELNWADQSNPINWLVYSDGANPNTTNPLFEGSASSSETSTTISGLQENTTYQVYLQTDCDEDGLSNLSLPLTFTTAACPIEDQCTFTFNLLDSFGDGWNGNIVELRQDGQLVANLGADFTAGNSLTETYNLCDDSDIELIWLNQGAFADEVGLNVVDPFGEEIFELSFNSGGQQGSTIFSFTSACTPPACPKVQNVSLSNILTNSVEISWDITPNASQGYTWFVFNEGANPTTATPVSTGSVSNTETSATATGLSESESYDVYVQANCDDNEDSDFSDVQSFVTACGIITAPYLEDFNSSVWQAGSGFFNTGDAIDQCWTRNQDGHRYGTRSGGTSLANSGPNEALFGSNYIYAIGISGDNGQTATITSPQIDLSTLTNPGITFYYHMFGSNIGTLDLQVKSINASSWSSLQEISGQQQSSSADDWAESIVSLDAFENEIVQYRFVATKGNGFNADIALDGIEVNNVNPCLRPVDLEISNIDLEEAQLSWSPADNAAESFVWEVYLTGQTPGEDTPVTTGTTDENTTSALLTNLEADTSYEAYVLANCEGELTSNYSFPIQFSTLVCEVEDTCDYTFTLTDSFGDGWNGNTMSVFQNGELVQVLGQNFNSGSQDVEVLALCSDASIELFWNAGGSFASEVGVIITNPFDEEIYENLPGQGSQNTSLVTFTSDCDSPEACIPPINFEVVEVLEDSVELTWDNIASAISGYNWFIFNAEDNPQSTPPVANGSTAFEINSVNVSGLQENTEYQAYIRSDCGFTGVSPISDPLFFKTPCSAFDAPFLEDFEGSQWVAQSTGNESIDECWSREPDFNAAEYAWFTGSQAEVNNPIGNNFIGASSFLGTTNDVAVIRLPAIDLSSLEDPSLNYFYLLTGEAIESFKVEIKINNNDDWDELITYTTSEQNNISEAFVREIIDLQAYANQIVDIRFVATRGAGNSFFALDDLRVDEIPVCDAPLNLSISNIETDSAVLTFDDDESAINGYDWFIYLSGDNPETDDAILSGNSSSNLNVALANLSPATTYDVYVQSNCLNNEISELSLPVTFSTEVCEDEDKCAYTFSLSSDSGNGWSGATMQVFQEGILMATLGESFNSGAEIEETIELCEEANTTLVWSEGGSASTDVNISITDPFNEEIYDSTNESINPGETLFNFTSNCTPPICQGPTNVEVSDVTQTTATISWDETDATQLSYSWFIFLAGDNPEIDIPVANGTTQTGELSVNVSDLTLDTAYQVYVQAECEFSESELSSAVDFSTFGACEAPENVVATEVLVTEATFSWDDFLNAISGYNWEIYEADQDPDLESPIFSGSLDVGETSVTVTGLSELTDYNFYIQSDCDIVESDLVLAVAFSTTGDCVEPSGDDFQIDEVTQTSVLFSWSASPEDPGAYSYVVHFEGEGPDVFTAVTTWGTSTPNGFSDDLEPSTTYDVYIRNNCSFGFSDFVGPFTFSSLDPVCNLPSNINIANTSTTQITLAWDEVELAENGYFWYLYDEFAIPEEDTPIDFGNVAFGETSVVIDGLSENTTYQIFLESDCNVNVSELSDSLLFTTENEFCETPDNFFVSLITDTSATLSWDAITDDTQNLTFGGYTWFIYNVGDTPGVDTPIFSDTTEDTSVNLEGLSPETTYQAYIQANCDTGSSNLSAPFIFSTTDVLNACQPAVNISVSNIGQTSLFLTWDPPLDSPVIEYTWVIREDLIGSGPIFVSGVVDPSITEIAIDGLEPNTDYSANVVTDCGTQFVGTGVPVFFTTLDDTDFPPNDDVCNATFIPEFSTVISDNTNATVQTNEPTPSCFDAVVESTVWFYYVAPTANDTDILVQSINNSGTADIAVYEDPDDCTDLTTLVEVACGVGTGTNGQSMASPSGLTPGETYYVQVSFDALDEGTFEIEMSTNFSTPDFNQLQIDIYPNPSSHILHIEAPDRIEDVIIYNMLGQQVFTQNHNQNKIDIPVSNLESGKYFVRLQIAGETYIEGFLKD